MRKLSLLIALCGCDDLFNLEPIAVVDGAVDPPLDAGFDPARECPAEYALELFAGSRYRTTEVFTQAWNASDDCRDDKPGLTHLAVAATRDELDVLVATLVAKGVDRWWIGAVQPAAVTAPIDGWLWMTGEPVSAALWDLPLEPNDGQGTETDHEEQFAIIQYDRPGLIDIAGNAVTLRGLCECDGRPMATGAASAVDQARL